MAILGKVEFTNKVYDVVGDMKKKDVGFVVGSVFNIIMRECAAGNTVNITGFGKFDAPLRAARNGKNPQTGETIRIASKRAPRFHAGADFKRLVTEK